MGGTRQTLRFTSLYRIVIATASVVVMVAAVGPHGEAAPKPPKTCDLQDGRYDVGAGWIGDPAPGISVTSASDEQVVFDLDEGFELVTLCVKTGSELNNYISDATLPASGPSTITITKAGRGLGIGHLSFDTEAAAGAVTCPEVEAPEVSFDEPLYIDRQRAGGEPVSVVAQDGSISVSAHAGTTHVYKSPDALPGSRDFVLGYFNQTLTWRSDDGGRSWQYIGLAGQREGPHSITSTGFSDPDYAIDQAGNIYNVEIDLANVAVFMSPDDGQSYPIANPYAWFGDRPWLTALEENEVFLYVNNPRRMLKSSDGGVTWVPYTANVPVSSKSIPDPLNPNDGLIGPVGNLGRFAIGTEDEAARTLSWEQHDFGPLGASRQFFGTLGVDNAGNVYQAAAGGYAGSGDTTPNGEVSFTYFERETEETNAEKIVIPTPPGDALWPWTIAGDDGRAAVVWYQNLAGDPRNFYIYAAITHNAHGSTVTCSDGSTREIPPRFTVVNASARPIHFGDICLQGTTCNANPSFEGGDRRLGDFFTVNFDSEGNLFIASADTMLQNPLGGAKPVGNPIFIRQESGDRMLEQPMETRPTRCLWPLPSC